MPLYDLTRLQFPGDDSIYHHFHASWLISLADTLNRTFPEASGFEAIFEKFQFIELTNLHGMMPSYKVHAHRNVQ